MKHSYQLFRQCFLPAIFALLPLITYSQGTQWVTSVNVGGVPQLADWVFDVITTQEKNYFCVGFAKEDELNPDPRPDVPAFCLISPNGTLLGDGYIEDIIATNPTEIATGRLYNVVEGTNAYFAVGNIEVLESNVHYVRGILVKVDKTTLTEQHWDIKPEGYNNCRLQDITYVTNSSGNYMVVTGWADNGMGRKNWIGVYDENGQIVTVSGARHELVTDSNSGEMFATTHDVTPDGNIRIFGASKITAAASGLGVTRPDSDIQIHVTSYNHSSSTPFATTFSTPVNSITQRPYAGPNLSDPITIGANDIFQNFKPKFPPGLHEPGEPLFDRYPYGPKYKGTSFARDFGNCNEDAYLQNGLLYVEDFSDGSDDIPFSMIKSGNQLVVTALLNRLIMWGRGSTGTNIGLGNNDLVFDEVTGLTSVVYKSGVQCTEANDCQYDYESTGYYWGESYLLFFDINADGTTSLDKATYLGTMSGGDFIPKVIQTSDGGFAVSGTVTSCPAGLEPVGESEHMMIIKLDANGDVVWREHQNGPSEGACGFAITETPDGGIIVAGNTEGGGEEDFCIIKFGSDCDYSTATVLPNSGNDYIVSPGEVWNSDRAVKAHVVVPNGVQLTINGVSLTNKVTIRFADSKEVYNFDERTPIGITVQKGGRLLVRFATLTGFDCNGTQKMWDGINAEGNPGASQTTANQGFASFYSSDIINARQGIVAAAVWCGAVAPIVSTYAGTGSQATTYTSALYHGGPFGGAKIFGSNSYWINNKRSAIFMKYQHNLDKSWFFNCHFVSDGPLVDPSEMLQPIANDLNYNEPRGTATHVSIWHTRVQFTNCEFLGSTSIIPDYRPFGIEGDDPKIKTTGGLMKDLKIGIECRSPLGSILGNVDATSVTLDNVVQGINLRNSTADIIDGCHFLNIPEPNTFQGLSPVGIFGKFNKGALITGNDFHGLAPAEPTWGIVEHNTLDQGCEIKENEFFSARIGNQFEGKNGQLFATCNDYTGMGFSAWNAVKNANAGVLPAQGSPLAFQPKADNSFFDFCDGSSDIHITSDFAFAYFDKLGNPNPADEDCVSDIVGLNISGELTPPNCYVMTPPCPNPPCDRLAQYYQSAGTIRDRNVAIRGLVHTGYDVEGADLPARYDDVLTLLRYRNQPEDRMLLVGSLASMDRIAEAQTENNLLPNTTTESAAYKSYMYNMLSSGTDITAISAAQYNAAMASLTAENVSTRAMAENLQYMREGIYTPLIALSVEGVDSGRPAQERNKPQKINLTATVQVFPNPFKEEIVFDIRGLDAAQEYQLVITDLLGRTVLSYKNHGEMQYTWNSTGLPEGYYTYQLRSATSTLQSGKILKLKQ